MKLKSLIQLGLLLALCLAPMAFGDTLQYVGGGVNPGFGPYLVGPYNISINGQPAVAAICDDISTNIPGSNTWQATQLSITEADATSLRFYRTSVADTMSRYYQVAFLSQKLLDETNNTIRGYLQWAIWDIQSQSDSLALKGVTGVAADEIKKLMTMAAINATATDAIGWSVYKPVSGTYPNSQEFLIKTPEASAVLLLLVNLVGLVALIRYLPRKNNA